ncbi:hypothetical protein [Paraburkholderia sp. PGU19]|uniref:hypothetical protein n=1 Tax=Paraburkholderia sp. PGU19 TaxID=2735434 RepID=UPI0015D98DCE|nr:hypothetical protein [Paraburkholderia sp. PGU19]
MDDPLLTPERYKNGTRRLAALDASDDAELELHRKREPVMVLWMTRDNTNSGFVDYFGGGAEGMDNRSLVGRTSNSDGRCTLGSCHLPLDTAKDRRGSVFAGRVGQQSATTRCSHTSSVGRSGVGFTPQQIPQIEQFMAAAYRLLPYAKAGPDDVSPLLTRFFLWRGRGLPHTSGRVRA